MIHCPWCNEKLESGQNGSIRWQFCDPCQFGWENGPLGARCWWQGKILSPEEILRRKRLKAFE
jgi:hypothetical protein